MESLISQGEMAIANGQMIGVLFAFAFGIVSFLSPCVLPMAPPYLAYLGGTTLDRISGDQSQIDRKASRRVLVAAIFFVLGLGVVFVGLGVGMALGGNILLDNKHIFGLISGVLIVVFGLHFWGLRQGFFLSLGVIATLVGLWFLSAYLSANEMPVADATDRTDATDRAGASSALVRAFDSVLERLDFVWIGFAAVLIASLALMLSGWDKIPLLNREARFDGPAQTGSVGSSFVIGMAFAFGWTPCLGPILTAILGFAANSGSVTAGGALLGVYALGLGVPFILAALFINPFLSWARGFRKHLGTVEKVMGLMLVIVGMVMISGDFERFAIFLIETFPVLATIG